MQTDRHQNETVHCAPFSTSKHYLTCPIRDVAGNNNVSVSSPVAERKSSTVVCPLADSYVASSAREARSVAELAATKKEDKYSGLAADYLFQPTAVEILGPINESASDF